MATMINVKSLNEHEFEVIIDASSTTVHHVTIPSGYYERLTANRISREDLVRKSFEFLLERESNTMILRTFELPVISRYFPEFESVIKDAVSK